MCMGGCGGKKAAAKASSYTPKSATARPSGRATFGSPKVKSSYTPKKTSR